MIKQRLIFLDIDNTVYNEFGRISESTADAIRQAKNHGHKIIFNTGRIKAKLPEDILQQSPEGFITSAGAHIEMEGRCILDQAMRREDLCAMCNYLAEKHIPFELSSNTDTFHWEEVDDKRKGSVNKITYFASDIPVAQLVRDIGSYGNVINSFGTFKGKYNGEIFVKNVNKATGIQAVLQYYSINREDTVAFGDAPIDMEMLQYAGIGVAMGNASREIKGVADMVTTDNNKDGIYYGFLECGLI